MDSSYPIVQDALVRIRVHRIPLSTNVERVALACGHKGIGVDWVDHDPADRSALEALSGQRLVPVAEIDGRVLSDSPLILRELERLAPEPPLWPSPASRRAELDAFLDWFNLVWKVAPNRLADDLDAEPTLRVAWAAELRGSAEKRGE